MILMTLAMVIWLALEAIAGIVMRRYSPFQVVWTRYAVHLTFMLLVWGWREPSSLWVTKRPVFQLSRSLLMVGMPASWVFARQMGVSSAELMSIFWMAPLLILVLASAFLGERAKGSLWVAAALAYAGAILVLEPRFVPKWPSWALPFVMGLTFSGYVVMTRSLRYEPTRANLFYTAAGVFIVLTPVMPEVWVTPDAKDLAVLVVVGLLGWVGLYVLDRTAAAGPASISAPFAFAQLPILLLMAWVLDGDRPGGRGLVGSALIVALLVGLWAGVSRTEVDLERSA